MSPPSFHQAIIKGEPFERGLQIGQQLKPVILNLLSRWESHLKQNPDVSLEKLLTIIKTKTNYLNTCQQHTPDLLEEVKGIAQATELPFELIFAWQLLDEHSQLIQMTKNQNPQAEHCSTYAIKNNKGVFIGQTLDIPAYKDDTQTTMTLDDGHLQYRLFCQPGAIASFGINNKGLAVCVNSIAQLQPDTAGLPVSFMVRKLLQTQNPQEAKQLLFSLPHATGQNYLIADNSGFQSYECSKNKCVPVYNDQAVINYHTNHPIKNNDIPENLNFDIHNPMQKLQGTTQNRLQYLHQFQWEKDEPKDLKNFATILQNEPVCITKKTNPNVCTYITAAFHITQNNIQTIATPGPANQSPWQSFNLNK